MRFSSRLLIGIVATLLISTCVLVVQSQPPKSTQQIRTQAHALKKDGNFKEAVELFRQLLHEPRHAENADPNDVAAAIDCVARLGRYVDADEMPVRSSGLDTMIYR